MRLKCRMIHKNYDLHCQFKDVQTHLFVFGFNRKGTLVCLLTLMDEGN